MKYYVALITPVADQASIAAVMDEHHSYMATLDRAGQILAAGPFEAPTSRLSMIILAAGTSDEARALMDAEPLTAKGLRTYELRAWDVREGTVTRPAR